MDTTKEFQNINTAPILIEEQTTTTKVVIVRLFKIAVIKIEPSLAMAILSSIVFSGESVSEMGVRILRGAVSKNGIIALTSQLFNLEALIEKAMLWQEHLRDIESLDFEPNVYIEMKYALLDIKMATVGKIVND